jgi:pantothenate kinase
MIKPFVANEPGLPPATSNSPAQESGNPRSIEVSSPENFCAAALQELHAMQNLQRVLPERTIIGLCGTPGGGKSTLSALLARAAQEVGISAVVVPMDGFHLANAELQRLGISERKGAPDTFDVDGFVHLLQRLHTNRSTTIWAPIFHREIEESYAGELAINSEHSLVIVEGIHLLQTSFGWDEVLPLLDAAWYLECLDVGEQRARLVQRNIANGRTPQQAHDWVASVDMPNFARIDTTKHRAHTVFQLATW